MPPRDFRVVVTIDSLLDVALARPVTFIADVKPSSRIDGQDFDLSDIYTPCGMGWTYDDEADRTRYYYGEGDFVLVHDALVYEVENMILDFVWRALYDAARAYDEARDEALGL